MTTTSRLRHAAGLQVRRLSVSYGPEPVLRDLSFTLQPERRLPSWENPAAERRRF